MQERSGPDVFLSRTLKNAVVVRASSYAGTLEMQESGRADVIFSINPILFELWSQLPGSRVLDGSLGTVPQAMAMPNYGTSGWPMRAGTSRNAKSEGLVKAAGREGGVTRRGCRPTPVIALLPRRGQRRPRRGRASCRTLRQRNDLDRVRRFASPCGFQ